MEWDKRGSKTEGAKQRDKEIEGAKIEDIGTEIEDKWLKTEDRETKREMEKEEDRIQRYKIEDRRQSNKEIGEAR